MTASSRQLDDVQGEIIAEMAGLDDNLARYEYVIAQGKALRVPERAIRTEENAVPGCQSGVWVRAELQDGRVRLTADSDALITRGIVALLLRVLDGRTPGEIVAADLYFLQRTGLGTHLSPARANGVAAMVRRIRDQAAAYLDVPGSR